MAKSKKRARTRKVAPKGNTRKILVMPIGHSVVLRPSEMITKTPEDFKQ